MFVAVALTACRSCVGDFEMTSFLNFHAFATTRGDGLRPELRALFERVAAAPRSELTVRNDGMIQSGPDPISAEAARERGNVSVFRQASARHTGEGNQNPGTPARFEADSKAPYAVSSRARGRSQSERCGSPAG